MTECLKVDAVTEVEEKLWKSVDMAKNVIAGVRAIRNQNNISPRELLELQVVGANPIALLDCVVMKMANLSALNAVEAKGEATASFLVGTTEYAVPIGNLINAEEEIAKMEAEVKRLEGFLVGVQKKLSNERFVANAPAEVVALEKKKQADAESKIQALKDGIKALKG